MTVSKSGKILRRFRARLAVVDRNRIFAEFGKTGHYLHNRDPVFAEPLRYRKQTAIRIKDHTIHIMLGKTRKHFLHPRFIERRMFQQKRDPIRRAVSQIRFRISGESRPRLFNAVETAIVETPSAAAISFNVTVLLLFIQKSPTPD